MASMYYIFFPKDKEEEGRNTREIKEERDTNLKGYHCRREEKGKE
jgi:hypothetical protein